MISNLIIMAFFLSAYHFLYERIIGPTWRDSLRHELFALRDELRRLRAERPDECSGELFSLLDEGICRFINRLGILTFSFVRRMNHEYDDNEEFRKAVAEAEKLLDECTSEVVKGVFRHAEHVLGVAFLCNSGGVIPYLLPVVVVVVPLAFVIRCIAQITSWIKRMGLRTAKSLVLMPPEEAARLMPALAA